MYDTKELLARGLEIMADVIGYTQWSAAANDECCYMMEMKDSNGIWVQIVCRIWNEAKVCKKSVVSLRQGILFPITLNH